MNKDTQNALLAVMAVVVCCFGAGALVVLLIFYPLYTALTAVGCGIAYVLVDLYKTCLSIVKNARR